MKYSNELKVGLAVVLSVIVLILGIRFFQDLPLFDRTVTYQTVFENASGLVSGNAVRVNGVRVGAVEEVHYDPAQRHVIVDFYIDPQIRVTEGSVTEVAGFPTLGDVRINLELGPEDNPLIEPGERLPSREVDILADISDRAPEMIGRADTTLMQLQSAMAELTDLVEDPDRELGQALRSVSQGADAITRVLSEEQHRMAGALDSVAHLSGSLNRFVETNQDTLGQAVGGMNQVIERLDRNLEELESTTQRVNTLMDQVENGEGTLGLLVNDPSLYHNMDSTAVRLNEVIDDFQRNPRRYLRELSIIEFF